MRDGQSAWAPLVPYAKARVYVNDQQFGLLLWCFGAGSILSMPTMDRLGVVMAVSCLLKSLHALFLFCGASLRIPLVMFPTTSVSPAAPTLAGDGLKSRSICQRGADMGSLKQGSKALLHTWGLRQGSTSSEDYLQRRLHLWFEIKPPAIDIEDPWQETPAFDLYAFTLPTSAGSVTPARWRRLKDDPERTYSGVTCDLWIAPTSARTC